MSKTSKNNNLKFNYLYFTTESLPLILRNIKFYNQNVPFDKRMDEYLEQSRKAINKYYNNNFQDN